MLSRQERLCCLSFAWLPFNRFALEGDECRFPDCEPTSSELIVRLNTTANEPMRDASAEKGAVLASSATAPTPIAPLSRAPEWWGVGYIFHARGYRPINVAERGRMDVAARRGIRVWLLEPELE